MEFFPLVIVAMNSVLKSSDCSIIFTLSCSILEAGWKAALCNWSDKGCGEVSNKFVCWSGASSTEFLKYRVFLTVSGDCFGTKVWIKENFSLIGFFVGPLFKIIGIGAFTPGIVSACCWLECVSALEGVKLSWVSIKFYEN